MKKHMSLSGKNKALFRSVLTVLCVTVVMLGASFTSYAQNGTVNRSNVNVRAEAGTTGAQVGTVTTNDVVEILSETMGTDGFVWYKIKTSAGVTGFVRSDFITKVVDTNPPADDDEEEEEEEEPQAPATQVTDTEDKTAYVKGTSSVNIRQDASTSSGRVASANGGSQITIVGEATGTDGYKWYKVEFIGNGAEMSGFIRSDLITFEAPQQDPEVTEIEGEAGTSEEPSEEPSEPSEEPSETPSESETTGPSVSGDRNQFVVMEPESYLEDVPEGFTEIDFAVGDNSFTAWEKGSFYILYASVDGATPKYYLYDYVTGGYITYADLFPAVNVTEEEPETGLDFKLIAIICGAVALILLVVVIVMSYKLANVGYTDDDYDDSDYDDEEDDDYDDEEMISLDDDDIPFSGQEPVVSVAPTVVIPDVTEVTEANTNEDGLESGKVVSYEEDDEEEFEEVKPSAKKEKKSFGKKFLDYFTVEVEDDEDYDDDDEDDEDDFEDDEDDEIEVSSKKSSAKSKVNMASHSYIDDDDDDLNFIDL